MMKTLITLLVAATCGHSALAHDKHVGGIQAATSANVQAAFDIVHANITTKDNVATFHMAVSGKAGVVRPAKSGKLAGAAVFSYVWPTTIDPFEVGFERKAGILALAVTSHPDFDDTPFFDENGDGDPTNDGDVWHSHWVVLQPDDTCGKGALKVADIAPVASRACPRRGRGYRS